MSYPIFVVSPPGPYFHSASTIARRDDLIGFEIPPFAKHPSHSMPRKLLVHSSLTHIAANNKLFLPTLI